MIKTQGPDIGSAVLPQNGISINWIQDQFKFNCHFKNNLQEYKAIST